MKKIKHSLTLLLITIPFLSHAQKNITEIEKDTTVKQVKALIDSNYVFADRVKFINDSLDSLNEKGKYDDISDYKEFANVLSEDLVEITQDKHFKIQYRPDLIKSRREALKRQQARENEEAKEDEEEAIDWNLWYAKKENFGFEKIEILDGNIGYIKLNFFQPLDWAKSTIDSAMGFVANTDALIIDLTQNQGGYSPTDSYLGSYFFDENPMLWMSSYERRTGETNTQSTFQEIGGERYLNRPVLILVSENTFSNAEKFAYSMKHFDKAKIVGQTSAGAAHAIDFIEVNDNFMFQIPILNNIHPATKKDWEGTGVIPHIKTNKDDTLKTAYLRALERLIEHAQKKDYQSLLKRYDQIKQKINES